MAATTSFQLDEFYLDLQEDGSRITLLGRDSIEYCPFPGLRPFRTSEFQLFKGREGQAEELLERLRKNHFLAVIGSSGTGKSSLIRAGLIPQLYGGYLQEAGSSWNIAICRPGRDPLENLSISLSSIKCQSRDKDKILAEHALIGPMLQQSMYGILEVNELLHAQKHGINSNLLIIIDQFEELFRFDQMTTGHGHVKNHFVNLLLKASLQFDSSIYVIITMRSEFLGECVKYRGLPEVINEGQYLVPQLGRSQVKDVIEGPLNLAGRQIETGLLAILLNEIEETRIKDSLDQLPILQHALMRTYKRAKTAGGKPMITHQDYTAIGGMEQALALHAEAKYNELAEPGQDADAVSHKQRIAQIVFQALTDLSSEQKGGRRPVELANIHAITKAIGASDDETNDVINGFRDIDTSFIMPPANTPLAPSLIIDISHESLMRNWQRLNHWMLEEKRYGELYVTLDNRRILYEREEDQHNRLRGILLKELIKWRDIPYHNDAWAVRYHKKEDREKTPKLFEKNIAFLQSSEQQDEKAEQQEKIDLEQKIKTQQQNTNNRRITRITSVASAVSVVLLILAVIGMRNAVVSKADAETQALLARKKIFEIYLRDSTQWWVNPLLSNERRQRVLDTLFDLYTSEGTHKPSHHDSLAGKKLETSLLMLKRAFNRTRLNSWGNYLHLLKEARDYDTNFVTSAVLDSILTMTIPSDAYSMIDTADQPGIYKGAPYLLMPIQEKDSAAFILVSRRGIIQYYFDGRPKEIKCLFPGPCKPLAIDKGATVAVVALDKQIMLYQRDRLSGYWRPNSSLSMTMPAQPQQDHPKPPISGVPTPDIPSNLVAGFSDDGKYLAIYDGDSTCKVFEPSTQNLQRFTTGRGVHNLIFSHDNSRLLVCRADVAELLDLGAKPVSHLLLFNSRLALQLRPQIALSGWIFSPDDAFVYAWSDSSRHTWTTSDGQYKGSVKVNIDHAEQYIDVAGEKLLYTIYKEENTESIPLSGSFIYLYDSAAAGKCFPWHNSTIQTIDPEPNGRIISGDITSIYTWRVQSGRLTEADIDRFIDKQQLSEFYLDMAIDNTLTPDLGRQISYLKKAAYYDPTNADVWARIAYAYSDSPTPDSAVPYIRNAIKLSAKPILYLSYLGRLFYRLNQYDSALTYATRTLKLDTTAAAFWDNVAQVYYSTNSVATAITYYRRAIALRPGDNEILNNLAEAYIEAKQYDSAIACIDKVLFGAMNSAILGATRACYFNQTGNYSASILDADSAIQLDPVYARGYAELGYGYLKTGKDKLALEALTKAISLDTADYIPLTYLACFYALHNNRQAALDYLEKAIGKGFRLWDWLDNEPGFDGLRNDKAFIGLRKLPK